MSAPKTAHTLSYVAGLAFLALSFYLAFFLRQGQFYTSFALGSWLVLDYVDYRLNNTSILSYFFNHKHRHVFYFFFFVAFIFCFIIDFTWGVSVFKMWNWVGYQFAEYFRMYLVMNVSYLLGMYELYRVMHTLLKDKISDNNLLNFRIPYRNKDSLYILMLLMGILFLISPFYIDIFKLHSISEYFLIFPYLSMVLITDAITFFTRGRPILEQFIRLNKLKITAVLVTVVLAFIATEGLNYFGSEWRYLRMPFNEIKIFDVPLTVLVGWIPLVIGAISLVNMVKHIGYVEDGR